jgi:hypothetical protein
MLPKDTLLAAACPGKTKKLTQGFIVAACFHDNTPRFIIRREGSAKLNLIKRAAD